jgi:hypothetical protein
LPQQGHGGHDLAGLAVAALRHALVQPGLLHRVQSAIGPGQAFDGFHRPVLHGAHRQQATALRLAIQQHGAGAALTGAAAELGAHEAQVLAQHGEQGFVLPVGRDGDALAVHEDVHGGAPMGC